MLLLLLLLGPWRWKVSEVRVVFCCRGATIRDVKTIENSRRAKNFLGALLFDSGFGAGNSGVDFQDQRPARYVYNGPY